jgi:hypothetical protein
MLQSDTDRDPRGRALNPPQPERTDRAGPERSYVGGSPGAAIVDV